MHVISVVKHWVNCGSCIHYFVSTGWFQEQKMQHFFKEYSYKTSKQIAKVHDSRKELTIEKSHTTFKIQLLHPLSLER